MAPGYSNTVLVKHCDQMKDQYRIYPAVFNSYITVSGLLAFSGEQLIAEIFDAAGRLVISMKKTVTGSTENFILPSRIIPGTYFIRLKRRTDNQRTMYIFALLNNNKYKQYASWNFFLSHAGQ